MALPLRFALFQHNPARYYHIRCSVNARRIEAPSLHKLATLPVVAIVGRPNVGKSTLFNRLCGIGKAIVTPIAGTTRDMNAAEARWRNAHFVVVDTGGVPVTLDSRATSTSASKQRTADSFQRAAAPLATLSQRAQRARDEAHARRERVHSPVQPTAAEAAHAAVQLERAMAATVRETVASAAVVVILGDVTLGIGEEERQLALLVRRAGKADTALVAVNKCDNDERREAAAAFDALRLGSPFPVSAMHGDGTIDLFDAVADKLSAARASVSRTKTLHVPTSGESASSSSSSSSSTITTPTTDEVAVRELASDEPLDANDAEEEFLDDSTTQPDETDWRDERAKLTAIAIVGRPNVGKSSLLNAVLPRQRALVSPVAGTTHDPVDLTVQWVPRVGVLWRERSTQAAAESQPPAAGDPSAQSARVRDVVLIDTAGMMRRDLHRVGISRASLLWAQKAVARADVAIVLLDATAGVTEQDMRIAGMVESQKCSAVIVLNKSDLLQQHAHTKRSRTLMEKDVRRQLQFLHYAPVVFASALTGENAIEVIDTAIAVRDERTVKLSTRALNNMLRRATVVRRPPRACRLTFITQAKVATPTFTVFATSPEKLHASYLSFLENQIRALHPYRGTPIRVVLKEASRRDRAPTNERSKQG